MKRHSFPLYLLWAVPCGLLAYLVAKGFNFKPTAPPHAFPPTEARIDPDNPAGA